jgi:hypothetical protein
MRESILPNSDFFGEYGPNDNNIVAAVHSTEHNTASYNNGSYNTAEYNIAPFFSMRKLRLIYNELTNTSEFEFATFDAFKQQVLSSVAPQLELNKWQSIAARR